MLNTKHVHLCWQVNMTVCVSVSELCLGPGVQQSPFTHHVTTNTTGACVCVRVRVGDGRSGRGKHDHFLPPLENKTNRKLSNSRSRRRLSEEPTESVKSSEPGESISRTHSEIWLHWGVLDYSREPTDKGKNCCLCLLTVHGQGDNTPWWCQATCLVSMTTRTSLMLLNIGSSSN